MWDLIVSVPDHCLSFYFESLHPPRQKKKKKKERKKKKKKKKPRMKVYLYHNKGDFETMRKDASDFAKDR